MNPRLLCLGAVVAFAACQCRKSGGADAGADLGPTQAWLKGEVPSVDAGAPRQGGTLTIRVPNEPPGLNRLHERFNDGVMVRYTQATVYESLAEIDRQTYALKPRLALGWEESADHLTLTARLRPHVRFHNGEPFTADDVVAVVNLVLNPKAPTQVLRSDLVDLESCTAVEPLTVRVKWKRPYVFGTRQFLATLPMMPRSALQGDFNTAPILRAPIGTGPFRFVHWEPGGTITFERFDGYWGTPAFLDRVVVRAVPDATVATQLWQSGAFGLMTQIPPQTWRAIEAPTAANAWAQRGYDRSAFTNNQYSFIAWNQTRPYFADVRVRRALAMLFPWDAVAKNVDLGLEWPTTCPYPAEASCDPEVRRLPFNPAEAAKLLDEAGWKDSDGDGVREKGGVPFRFAFMATANSVRMGKLLPLYQAELASAGVALIIEPTEAATYVSRLQAHDFDAAALSWATLDAVSDTYQVFHSSQVNGGPNYVSYQDATVDAWLEQIRAEFDDAKRAALERKVHRKLYDDQVYLFLTRRPLLDAISKDVHGLQPSLLWYDLSKAWMSAKAP